MYHHIYLIFPCIATVFAANHDILVGQSGLSFTPETTVAAVGDTLTFHFFPRHHSVVRGPYETPCSYSTAANDTFFSGFIPSTSGAASQTFTVTVKDTKPMWYYCSQASHCQLGMAGVVNPP